MQACSDITNMSFVSYVTWSFHGSDDSSRVLLDCDAV